MSSIFWKRIGRLADRVRKANVKPQSEFRRNLRFESLECRRLLTTTISFANNILSINIGAASETVTLSATGTTLNVTSSDVGGAVATRTAAGLGFSTVATPAGSPNSGSIAAANDVQEIVVTGSIASQAVDVQGGTFPAMSIGGSIGNATFDTTASTFSEISPKAANADLTVTTSATGSSITLNSTVTCASGGTMSLTAADNVFLTSGGINTTGPVNLASVAGAIVEASAATVICPTLTTGSFSGTEMTYQNAVAKFTATDDIAGTTASNGVYFLNTAPLLTVGVNASGIGPVAITNTGAITTTEFSSNATNATGNNSNITLLATGTITLGGSLTEGGSGRITLDSTAGNLLINAPVVTPAGGIDAFAAGDIVENGGLFFTSGSLTTSSTTGQTLRGANSVGSFNATNTSGGISLVNTAETLTAKVTSGGQGYGFNTSVSVVGGGGSGAIAIPQTSNGIITGIIIVGGTGYTSAPKLTITTTKNTNSVASGASAVAIFNRTPSALKILSIQETGGSANVANTGSITITGSISVAGSNTLTLTSSAGAIAETGVGSIACSLLMATSSTGQTFNAKNNQIRSFNSVNSSTGNVELTDSIGVTIAKISQTTGSIVLNDAKGFSLKQGVITTKGMVVLEPIIISGLR